MRQGYGACLVLATKLAGANVGLRLRYSSSLLTGRTTRPNLRARQLRHDLAARHQPGAIVLDQPRDSGAVLIVLWVVVIFGTARPAHGDEAIVVSPQFSVPGALFSQMVPLV
jgi:hypothetical protein